MMRPCAEAVAAQVVLLTFKKIFGVNGEQHGERDPVGNRALRTFDKAGAAMETLFRIADLRFVVNHGDAIGRAYVSASPAADANASRGALCPPPSLP